MERPETSEVQIARILWRLDALDEWRRHMDKRLSVLESKVSNMTLTDKVAELLAEKLSEKKRLELTAFQKVGAGMFAVMLVMLPVLIGKLWG